MTTATLTFIGSNTVRITNNGASTATYSVYAMANAMFSNLLGTIEIAAAAYYDWVFATDNIYLITTSVDATGNTVILYPNVLEALETDVKEVLLANDLLKKLPEGYDFVTLTLLSILFVGNTQYQNVLYNSGNLTNYLLINDAILRCSKYMDRQHNTPQSTNRVWQ